MHLIATCLQIMSGILVFVRLVDECRTKNILSQHKVVVVKCFFFCGWSLLVLTFGLGVQFVFLLGALLFVALYVLFNEQQRQARLRKEIYELLQTLILRLAAGESLPSALLSAKKSGSADLKIFLSEEMHLSLDRRLLQTRSELNEIPKFLHQSISRLRWLRESWDTEEQFRQKKLRATSMIRAQAGLLCFLYAGLLFFTLSRYPYFSIRYYLNISLMLFVVGIIVLLAIERGFRWKV